MLLNMSFALIDGIYRTLGNIYSDNAATMCRECGCRRQAYIPKANNRNQPLSELSS